MKIEKLTPACQDYIWGGVKLKEKYGKITEKTPCAESWELSFHKDGLTRTSDGRTLAECFTEKDFGENAKRFPFFPILIKLLDAKQNLSVQVHPSDDYALKYENSFGKTEMWYIVEGEEGAGVYLGFKRDVTKEEFEKAIEEQTLMELLNFYPAKAGDCFFIPSGTIHAIGAGCLICEIQQNSNLTYRVYDYGRTDANGNPRQLHVEKALKVTDFSKFQPPVFENNVLGESEYFHVEKLCVVDKTSVEVSQESFVCAVCVKGECEIEGQSMRQGDSYFIPAGYGKVEFIGNAEILLTKV